MLCVAAVVGPAASATPPVVGVASSVEQIRPDASAAGRPTFASLVAARNEFESFQIVVDGPTENVSVSGDLFGWGTTTLYRVGYYEAVIQSDPEGGVGRWGDVLIPERDVIYGEDRNAFPLDIPAGENRLIWVDVHIPPETAPGVYTDDLTLSSDDGSRTVPVTVDVLDLDLPSTASLTNAFFVTYNKSDDTICRAHTGSMTCNGDAALRRSLHSMYTRIGLENRVTLANGFALRANHSPAFHPAAAWESTFEAPLIHGTTTFPTGANYRLSGPRVTTVAQYAYVDDECMTACANEWEAEANEAGQVFADRVQWYGCDEASGSSTAWESCNDALQQTMAGWRRPAFATGNIAHWEAAGEPTGIPITTLIPNIIHIHGQRPAYEEFLAKSGHAMWLYSSCNSHGCGGGTGGPDGYPGYAIDAPAVQARTMSWMVDRYDASGELYWSANELLADAWEPGGLFWDGGNGDGTLFYPGTVAQIGGTQDIPLDSIRLKRIRDGREDFEYITWLRWRGRDAEVDAIVSDLLPTADSAVEELDGSGPGTLLAARDELIVLIREETGGSPAGNAIVFSSNRDGDFEIFTMGEDGGGVTQLTTSAAADSFPAWSPDGRKIAWTRGNDVWVMDPDGSNQVNLTSTMSQPASKPAWFPAGDQLVFVVDEGGAGGPTDLWTMAADGSDQVLLFTYSSGGYSAYDPTVTPAGDVIFSFDGQLAKVLPGGGYELITTGHVDEVPDVSADGTRMTFSRSSAGAPYDVWTSDPDGTDLVNLTETVGGGPTKDDFQSSFSPAGDELIFVSNVDGDTEVWRVDADRANAVALTTNAAADLDPDWNPVRAGGATCLGRSVTVDIGAGETPTDGPDVVLGTEGPDSIYALGGDDVVCGLGGADHIATGADSDQVSGGAGRDRVNGGASSDALAGGAGRDRLVGATGADDLNGGPGNDTCAGGAGTDTGTSCETATGIP